MTVKLNTALIARLAQRKSYDIDINFILIGSNDFDKLSQKNPFLTKTSSSLINLMRKVKEFNSEMGFFATSFNQLSLPIYAFCVLKPEFIVNNKYFNYKESPENYEIIFNPRIIYHSDYQLVRQEFCPSFPNMIVRIPRYLEIGVEYINEKFERVIEKKVGFEAVVFQNRIDLLEGNTIQDNAEEHDCLMNYVENDDYNKTEYQLKLSKFVNKIETEGVQPDTTPEELLKILKKLKEEDEKNKNKSEKIESKEEQYNSNNIIIK